MKRQMYLKSVRSITWILVWMMVMAPLTSTRAIAPDKRSSDSSSGGGLTLNVIYSDVAADPSSSVPGLPGALFESFDKPFGSANGNWILSADTNLATTEDEIILVNDVVKAREGTLALWTTGENVGLIDQRLGINDNAEWVFATNTDGVTTADEYIVKVSATDVFTSVAQEGGAVGAIPGAFWGITLDTPVIASDGSSGLRSTTLTGIPATVDEAITLENTVFAQEGVTIPTGQLGTEFWDVFDLDGYWISADGSHWMIQGDLTGDTNFDDVVVVDGAVVVQEGVILAGTSFAEPVDLNGIVEIHMARNGDWYIRGNNDVTEQDWIYTNNGLLATLGDPIFTGATEVFTDTEFADCFFLHVADSNGNYIIGGVSDGPTTANGVIVLNGTHEVARENDPIDLNGNGQFDDNLFINTFGNDDGYLSDAGIYYFVATMRDGAGVAAGDVFISVDLSSLIGGGGGDPEIIVTPASLSSTQLPDTTITQTLTISNVGNAALNWTIFEEASVLVNPQADSPALPPTTGSTGSRTSAPDNPAPLNYASPADFSEDFADITNLPGWFMQNNSAPLGSTSWFQGNSAVFPAQAGAPTAYIGANFNNTSGVGTISNWLLTPELNLTNGDTLSFWTRQPTASIFPDRLQIRLSTAGASTNVGTGAEDVGDFTTLLLDINPTLSQGGYPDVWTQFTVTLSGIPGGATGRFGFRYYVTNAGPSGSNSDYIGIDTVEYVSNPVCTAPSDIPWASVNPTSGSTNAGEAVPVEVLFDSTGLSAGLYSGNLCISSNDPATPLVTVPLNLTVEAFTYGVDLSGNQAASALPGETVTYTLSLTNTGNTTDIFDLNVASVWTASQSDTSVSLASGETTSIWVAVTAPAGALAGESDTATVTATSQSDGTASDSADLTTTALVAYGVDLSGDQAASASPGGTVTYTLAVTNTGNTTDTFDLAVNSGWPATPSDTSVTLDAGASTTVWITVSIPAGTEDGDSDTATVTATSQTEPTVTDSASLTTTAGPIYAVDLSGDQAASGGAGGTVSYVMTITNTGNTTNTYDLSTTGVWTATLASTSVTLGAGETMTFTVDVVIPADATNGVFDVTTVTATSQIDTSATDSADLTTMAFVDGKEGFDLYLPLIFKNE